MVKEVIYRLDAVSQFADLKPLEQFWAKHKEEPHLQPARWEALKESYALQLFRTVLSRTAFYSLPKKDISKTVRIADLQMPRLHGASTSSSRALHQRDQAAEVTVNHVQSLAATVGHTADGVHPLVAQRLCGGHVPQEVAEVEGLDVSLEFEADAGCESDVRSRRRLNADALCADDSCPLLYFKVVSATPALLKSDSFDGNKIWTMSDIAVVKHDVVAFDLHSRSVTVELGIGHFRAASHEESIFALRHPHLSALNAWHPIPGGLQCEFKDVPASLTKEQASSCALHLVRAGAFPNTVGTLTTLAVPEDLNQPSSLAGTLGT